MSLIVEIKQHGGLKFSTANLIKKTKKKTKRKTQEAAIGAIWEEAAWIPALRYVKLLVKVTKQ